MATAELTHTYPNHCRESADVISSQLISRGISPNAPDNFPKNVNAYPLLNHVITSIFINSSSNYLKTLHVMRTSYWLSTLIIILLFFLVNAYTKISFYINILASGLLSMHLVLMHNTMGSKPGALGFLFLLLGIGIPYICNFRAYSLMLGCLFITLATFTKEYNIIGYALLLGYYFIFIERKKTLLFVIFSTAIYIFMLLIYDYYIVNSATILLPGSKQFTQVQTKIFSIEYEKCMILIKYFFPLLVYLFFCIIINVVKLFNDLLQNKFLFNQPNKRSVYAIISNKRHKRVMPYPTFLLISSLLIYFIIIVPKTNSGHYYYNYTYLFFLLWGSIFSISKSCSHTTIYIEKIIIKLCRIFKIKYYRSTNCSFILLIILLLICYMEVWKDFSRRKNLVTTDRSKEWNELRVIISKYKNILAFRMITPILCEQEKNYTDAGQSEFSDFVSTNSDYSALVKAYKNSINNKIRNNYYDALFLTKVKIGETIYYHAYGVNLTKKELNNYGYYIFYEKKLHSTLYPYNISGWRLKALAN